MYLKNYLKTKLSKVKEKIEEEVDRFKKDGILNGSEENLVKSLAEKYTVHPLTLKLDEKYLSKPKKVNVKPGHELIFDVVINGGTSYIKTSTAVVVPFEGNKELFYHQPSTFELYKGRLILKISEDEPELYLEYEYPHSPTEDEIENNIKYINSCLNYVKNDIDEFFNKPLKNYIRELVKTKNKEK